MKIPIIKNKFLYSLALTGILIFAACNGKQAKKQDPSTTTNSSKSVPERRDAPVEDMTFSNEKGEKVSLSSFRGKVVFINFWTTWCPPCIHELPTIDRLKKSFASNSGIVFLMVDIDGKIDKSAAFMKENKYDLPVYVSEGMIPRTFLGDAIRATVILSKKGVKVDRIEGGRVYGSPEVKNALSELIFEP